MREPELEETPTFTTTEKAKPHGHECLEHGPWSHDDPYCSMVYFQDCPRDDHKPVGKA